MYIWPWLLNREAERQKDLQKKFPEVSNSEPSKTKTQQVSEKACDMCFSLFCLLYYQFAKCHVAFLQHGRMDHLLWRHARSRSWINLANKALEAARRDSSIFKLPEMLKSCSVLGYSDYVLPRSNISTIHVDTVRRCNGKRTIACNLWNSYSSWCFLRRIHWKTPKRRRMHQSRSRRHLEIRQESQNQFFEESNRSLGLACERSDESFEC